MEDSQEILQEKQSKVVSIVFHFESVSNQISFFYDFSILLPMREGRSSANFPSPRNGATDAGLEFLFCLN